MRRLPQLPLPGITFRHGSARMRMIPGWEGLAASDRGDIWSCRGGRWRKLTARKNRGRREHRYLSVTVRDRANGNGPVPLYLHRAVLLAWHGEPPTEGAEWHADHVDRDRTNNRPENLRWMSPDANLNRRRWGSGDGGELTEEDLEEMLG